MPNTFVKPEIKFPLSPFIYPYIQASYDRVETQSEFVDFVHACMSEAETTSNDLRRKAYTNIANALYSIETNISYESKAIEIMVQKLPTNEKT